MTISLHSRPVLIAALAAALSTPFVGQAHGDPAPSTPAWPQLPLPPIPYIETMAWLNGWKGASASQLTCVPANNVLGGDHISRLRLLSPERLMRDTSRAS